MKIVAISDTHCRFKKVQIPPCDLLISAGDYSFKGEQHVVRDFHKWLSKQPAKHKISVQGNHEKWVESNFSLAKQTAEEECPGVHFMDEGLVEIEGLKIWCSAITPFFYNWAWNRYSGEEIQKHWDKIPNNVDGIVTHGPCFGIVDSMLQFNGKKCEWEKVHLGCPQLLKRVLEVKPKFHISGHIHPGYGLEIKEGITFINAALCNDNYQIANEPIVIDL